jgi:hypothetical protein
MAASAHPDKVEVAIHYAFRQEQLMVGIFNFTRNDDE